MSRQATAPFHAPTEHNERRDHRTCGGRPSFGTMLLVLSSPLFRVMQDHLVAILRKPDEIVALVHRRAVPFEPPLMQAEGCLYAGSTDSPYIEEVVPLASASEALVANKALLVRSWEALASVKDLNEEVLGAVLHVLMLTLPDPAVDTSGVAPLRFATPSDPTRPTAAHPRAYRGTKYKPPKRARPAPMDLRPHLCVPANEARLLKKLHPYFDQAAGIVAREHPYGELLRDRGADALRPFAQAWAPSCAERIAALPLDFRRELLWALRGCDSAHVAHAISSYWALGLDQDTALRRCIAVLWSPAPVRAFVDWSHLVAHIPPPRRLDFAELLIETNAWRGKLTDALVQGIIEADALTADEDYRLRMFYVLRTIADGHTLDYALDGFRLDNEFGGHVAFAATASRIGVASAVRSFVEYVKDIGDWWTVSPLTLWEDCGTLDGLTELVSDTDWNRLDARSAARFVRVLIGVVFDDLEPEIIRKKWAMLRDRAADLVTLIEGVAMDFRPKALEHLDALIRVWDWDVAGLEHALGRYAVLLKRLCRPPFSTGGYAHRVLPDLSFADVRHWEAITALPEKTWLKLESATRRENDANLIGDGLRCLVCQWPELAIDALRSAPSNITKTAHTLGAMSSVDTDETIASFRKHPVAQTRVDQNTVEYSVHLAIEFTAPGITNPTPRRLAAHVRKARTLTPSQQSRDVKVMRQKWSGFVVDVLNQFALDRMASGMPAVVKTSAVSHALKMQRLSESHRRSVRRLLQSCLSGDRDYAINHPANRAWFDKHPRIDSKKWVEGVRLRAEVRRWGQIELAMERDPLEVLRLGSHFGTCLGIGGLMTHSAAAIALDVNKQVCYARDSRGRLLARQILAISEAEQLICYAVHPKRIAPDVRIAFREFDMRMAEQLGLELHRPNKEASDQEYEVAKILAQDYWDDGAWDFE